MTTFPPLVHTWLSAIGDIARAVNAAEPLDVILTRVADRACTLIGFDFCAVMLADPARERVTIAGWSGLSSDYIALISDEAALLIHPGAPGLDLPAARAFRERRTITVRDVAEPDAAIYGRLPRLASAQGYRSLLAAPLRGSDEVVGILVGYLEAPHEFAPLDVELAELLAEQTALAIQTARLRAAQQNIIAELRRQRAVLERAEQQHRRLMQFVLDDIGLDGLLTALADMLQASVTLEDAGGSVVASAAHGRYVAPPHPDARRGSVPADPARDLGRYEVTHVPGPGTGTWVAPVVVGGEHVGRLWVSGSADAPDPEQRRVIERFALVVAVEVLKRRHLTEVEERLSGDLMADLLRPDGVAQPRALLDRARALGHDLSTPHWLGVLSVEDEPTPIRFSALAREAAGTALLTGRYEDRLVLLVPATVGPLDVFRRVHDQAALHAEGSRVSLVISQRVADLQEYSRSYQLAVGAARLRRLSERGGLVDLRGLSVPSLLLMSGTPPMQLRQFAQALIGPLQSHDARRGTELVRTLRAWLEASFSTTAAAETLVVHANTVAYRLARVEALIGKELRRPDTRLEIQLALHVWDVLMLDDPDGR